MFDLLVKGVLKHFKSVTITGNKELGELWTDFKKAVAKPIEGTSYNITKEKSDVDAALLAFNTAFSKLIQAGSSENILRFAQPILDKFGHNIEIELRYTNTKVNADYNAYERNHVRISIKYLGKTIPKPHVFLNEARLSAIAISIYLGMVKRHIQGIPCKILFLNDIFIGLDITSIWVFRILGTKGKHITVCRSIFLFKKLLPVRQMPRIWINRQKFSIF